MEHDAKKLAVLLYLYQKRKKRHQRKWWVHPLNQIRNKWGEHLKLDRMHSEYPQKFFNYTRLMPAQFDKLLKFICSSIEKRNTNYRESVPPRIRLYITLRYLATGDSIRVIATNFSVGESTVWGILRVTCKAVWKVLLPLYLKPPSSTDWIIISEKFEELWNFPNCVGAIDGKHIIIDAPPKSGTNFLNYKGKFSIVLLATCDAEYKFTTVDIGAYGKQSDGGTFSASSLGQGLSKGTMNLPGEQTIKGTNKKLPCVFVGDEGFPLSMYLMRPFPGKLLSAEKRIFNYRLSRARRTIENAFGILASRFRIFRRAINAYPSQVENIVKASVSLHNFLRTEELAMDPQYRPYCPEGYADQNDEPNGAWRNGVESGAFQTLRNLSSNMHGRRAVKMREDFTLHFWRNGSIPWQNEKAGIKE